MPQLFPMNWMLMTTVFCFLFIFIMTLTFFFPMNIIQTTFINKRKNNKMFKW
uniref:ATP synthase F0 subunit 8 n=1 Tax=Ixodes hirsti TaxID=262304 RepID=UPI001FF3110D|nr:ATP synthase F0 subunit 8 [Ixodes hirsti]UOK09868.1 ATP synthase subunit 8 [Ixodes hirsti]